MNLDHCLQRGPYRITNGGIGANAKQATAKIVNPSPLPSAAVSGAVAKGKNVPIKQRVISTAVKAEAEYNPNASVT